MSIDLSEYNKQVATSIEEPTSKSTDIFGWLNQDIQLFGNQWSSKKKEGFYAELAVLLKAGLDLVTTLEMMEENEPKEKDRAVIAQIKTTMLEGAMFSEAMGKTERFSNYEVFSIKIAEESGKLIPILETLSEYYKKSIAYRRLLISALSYPIMVIGVSMLALLFLLNFLVPLFGDIYARLDQELPPVTQFIISCSEFVNTYLPWTIPGLLVIGILLYSQRKSNKFRKVWSAIQIKIPIFGLLVHQLYLARFAEAMSFLLSAKVPVLQALGLVKKMVAFYPIEASIDLIEKRILKGDALCDCLADFKIYPPRMVALIKVGEEANQLEAMFSKLAEQYSDSAEQRTKLLSSMIEPVLIVFLALVVGLVLVSMYLPIFKLVTNFG